MPTAAPVFMRRERKPWQHNSDDKRTYRGRALQRERAKLFAREPLCEECKRNGRVRVATIRDHKLALAFGGTDTDDNVQALCDPCHALKTAEESRAGRGVDQSLALRGRKAAG